SVKYPISVHANASRPKRSLPRPAIRIGIEYSATGIGAAVASRFQRVFVAMLFCSGLSLDWITRRAPRLAGGAVLTIRMALVFAVVAVIVIAVAHLFVYFVQDNAYYVGAQSRQCRHHAAYRFAIGLAGARHYHHAIHRRRHLQRLGEAKQGRGVQDYQV